jgi:hypothetical protein
MKDRKNDPKPRPEKKTAFNSSSGKKITEKQPRFTNQFALKGNPKTLDKKKENPLASSLYNS